MGKGRPRRLLRAAFFPAIQLALLVLTLEVALRFLKPHHRGLRAVLYRSATATDYSGAASLPELMGRTLGGFSPLEVRDGFVLNSRSFRTKEYALDKPDGTFRVIALGDSFTYGLVPWADAWTTRLEARLAERLGGAAEVLNLGVPGTGMPFQLRLWQLEGAGLDADLVVLGFFVGNDFFDELGMEGGWQGLRDRLVTVSYTFRVARNLYRWGRGLEHGASSLPVQDSPVADVDANGGSTPRTGGFELEGFARGFDDDRPTFSPEAYLGIEVERLSICLKEERVKFDFRFDRVARLVERLDWEVRKSGSRLVVMLIPDEFQVDDNLRAEVVRYAGREAGDYDVELPQARLKAFFDERGIELLDLLPLFRLRAESERLYLPRDSHWNRAGNQLAGDALAGYLERTE